MGVNGKKNLQALMSGECLGASEMSKICQKTLYTLVLILLIYSRLAIELKR